MPIVIGVGGRLTSGKDAFADHLVAKHGFVKMGMSDILKDATLSLKSVWVRANQPVNLEGGTRQYFHPHELVALFGYDNAKKQSEEYRKLLQHLGTEVGRKLIDDNVWVNGAAKRIHDQVVAGNNVVITGIRFENELRMIEDFDGGPNSSYPAVTVWIHRPSAEAAVDQHASEVTLSEKDFQWTINNTDTLEDLYDYADQLLDLIGIDARA